MSPRKTMGGFLTRHHQRQLIAVGRRVSNSVNSFTEFATGKETVGEMLKRRFIVIVGCPVCRRQALVDLRVIITLRGPETTLWNRHPQCRTVVDQARCRGSISFYARLGYGISGWYPLRDPPPTPEVRDAASGRPEPPLPDKAV